MSDDRETLRLQQMLLEVEGASTPDSRVEAIARIEDRYRSARTVLVGDLEGFTRRVQRHGIVPFIGTIYRMRRICGPLVAATTGYLFKAEADNLFAAFSEPVAAVRCALAMQSALAEDNRLRADTDRIGLGVGICSGEVLAIGHEDVWGHAINVASKLGEDVAKAGEVLVNEQTFLESGVGGNPKLKLDVHHASVDISGVELRYMRLTLRR